MKLGDFIRRAAPAIAAAIIAIGCQGMMTASAQTYSHSPCSAKPRYACPNAKDCDQVAKTFLGSAVEFKTQRAFFLDYPCDLKKGEKVAFILNLHGAGSIGNWQRSYFPAADYTQKYRLVVATPTALTERAQPGQASSRVWTADADDVYLHNIVDQVIAEFGKENIRTFWLAGHSQGGLTSRRIVCSDYFRDKVDGFISLSGGRVGTPATPRPAAATPPAGAAAATPPAGAAAAAPPAPLDCDFSFIFDIGQREAASSSATDKSEWAEKYGCNPRKKMPDVVDTKAGYVTATDQTRGPSWGTTARPGTANVYVYEGCKDGRVVADVVRLEKGHTEGLEPKITQKILDMAMSAKGGKLNAK